MTQILGFGASGPQHPYLKDCKLYGFADVEFHQLVVALSPSPPYIVEEWF